MSCTPHIRYKTKIEYVSPPKDLISNCKAVTVKDGATTKDELLSFISEAYVDTLSNINKCNIRLKEARSYIEKIKQQEKP